MLVRVGVPALLDRCHPQRRSTRGALAGGRGLKARGDDQANLLHLDDSSVVIEKLRECPRLRHYYLR